MPCCCVLGEPAIHPIKGRQRLSSKLYSFHILHLTDVLLNQKSKKKNWERNLLSEWRQSRLERPWKLKRTMITKQSRLDAFLFFFPRLREGRQRNNTRSTAFPVKIEFAVTKKGRSEKKTEQQ